MDPITLRLQSEVATQLEQEAEEAGFSSRSEYIRHLLHHRDTLTDTPPIGIGQEPAGIDHPDHSAESVDELAELVSDLEERIDQLEADVDSLRTTVDDSGASADSKENDTPQETNPDSSGLDDDAGNESPDAAERDEEFQALREWLQQHGPESDDAREIMLAAARILDSAGPLQTAELKDRLSERYPDAASYRSMDTLWASTVERLQDQTPGFDKPSYGTYSFDTTHVQSIGDDTPS